MAKYYGNIGYGESVESPPNSGNWVDQITEYSYFGDVIRNTRSLAPNEGVIGDISIGNSISIVVDAHAIENFRDIRYAEWDGARWTVTSVEVQRPRLILSLGGLYHGPTP
jgi:hypothetical protein